jgi:hypothetical protein
VPGLRKRRRRIRRLRRRRRPPEFEFESGPSDDVSAGTVRVILNFTPPRSVDKEQCLRHR